MPFLVKLLMEFCMETNPSLELFAIDAGTGEEIWKFSPHESGQAGFGVRHRGTYALE